MGKQIKIKEIAALAGVSAGTVDRVLHNRGKVSEKSLAAVQRVLSEVDYKFNINTSAVSFRKEFNILAAMPSFSKGEYWESLYVGIQDALEEYSDINMHCRLECYDQFDSASCRYVFDRALEGPPFDAVIIGPTFENETMEFCHELESRDIPYVFVDSAIDRLNPWASFSADQFSCGQILARVMIPFLGPEGRLVLLESHRSGNQLSQNSIDRIKGFRSYMEERVLLHRLLEDEFYPMDPERNRGQIEKILAAHPDVRGFAVLNSRGYAVAEALESLGRRDIHLVCFDLTSRNRTALEKCRIDILLCQRPHEQGFEAVKSLLSYVLYNQKDAEPHHLMPIDIIVKENLPYYRQ